MADRTMIEGTPHPIRADEARTALADPHITACRQRIAPDTDRAAAAILLGRTPGEVGYCPRCQGLTLRYGPKAQVLCHACPPGCVSRL